MNMRKKNKLILGITGLMLISGITYQNCGQIDQKSMNEKYSKNSQLVGIKSKETETLTITLKDGTQLKTRALVKQQYSMQLKDGTQIKFSVLK